MQLLQAITLGRPKVANLIDATITNKQSFTVDQYYKGVKLISKVKDTNSSELERNKAILDLSKIATDIKEGNDCSLVFNIAKRMVIGTHTVKIQGVTKGLRMECTSISIPISYFLPSYSKENAAKVNKIKEEAITYEAKMTKIGKIPVEAEPAVKVIKQEGDDVTLDLGNCIIDIFDKDIDFTTYMTDNGTLSAHVVKDSIKTTKALIGFQMKQNDTERRTAHYSLI